MNVYPKKIAGYSIKEQIRNIVPYLLLSLGVFITVYALSYLILNDVIVIILQVLTGILYSKMPPD